LPGARDGLDEGRSPWRPRPSSRRSTPGFRRRCRAPGRGPQVSLQTGYLKSVCEKPYWSGSSASYTC